MNALYISNLTKGENKMTAQNKRNRKALRKILYNIKFEGYKNIYNDSVYNGLSKKLKTWYK